MCNYRLISVLPNSEKKIIEIVVELQLVYFLESNNLFSSSQFSLRKGISTEHAIQSMVKGIHDHSKSNEYVIEIFLDIK